jgi:hypothetical protein
MTHDERREMKPLRAALFAPGSKERVMGKALTSGADAVILDLEDSVPIAAKAEARALVGRTIGAAAGSAAGPAIFVRTNATATGMLADDLAAIVRPGLAAVLMSKVESVDEVRSAAATLERLEAAEKMQAGAVEIILMIESALTAATTSPWHRRASRAPASARRATATSRRISPAAGRSRVRSSCTRAPRCCSIRARPARCIPSTASSATSRTSRR